MIGIILTVIFVGALFLIVESAKRDKMFKSYKSAEFVFAINANERFVELSNQGFIPEIRFNLDNKMYEVWVVGTTHLDILV